MRILREAAAICRTVCSIVNAPSTCVFGAVFAWIAIVLSVFQYVVLGGAVFFGLALGGRTTVNQWSPTVMGVFFLLFALAQISDWAKRSTRRSHTKRLGLSK